MSASPWRERKFWKSLPGDAACVALENANDPKLWNATAIDISDVAQEMINSAKNQKITNISGSLNVVCEKFEIMKDSAWFRDFTRLRNDLFHEALWDGSTPTQTNTRDAYLAPVMLRRFNQRLIPAILQYTEEFLALHRHS